jgi:hypothetical protein
MFFFFDTLACACRLGCEEHAHTGSPKINTHTHTQTNTNTLSLSLTHTHTFTPAWNRTGPMGAALTAAVHEIAGSILCLRACDTEMWSSEREIVIPTPF